MVGMVAAAEGAQIIVVTFCLSILQNKWNFSNNVQSFIISLNFAGLVVGGATAGFFADKFGRMKPMIVSLVLITVLNANIWPSNRYRFLRINKVPTRILSGLFCSTGIYYGGREHAQGTPW